MSTPYSAGDELPISLVMHTVYCPRRAWIESNGEKTDTSQMQEGQSAHKRVDDPKTSRGTQQRAVTISSTRLGLTGRCDAIDPQEDGSTRIIEYKATPVRRNASVTPAHRVQLALQKICLEEAGETVSECAVHFTNHNKTVPVDISDEDIRTAEEYVYTTRALIDNPTAPQPLEDSPRCSWCSHISVCLPDESHGKANITRVVASNPDSQVAHLTTQGSRATVQQGRLIVQHLGETISSVPLERVHSLVVHGNIDVSSALLRELMWRNCTIIWCSSTGRVYGWSQPGTGPNGLARVQQHVLSAQGHLPIAAAMIASKISNQATLLRRNGHAADACRTMRDIQKHTPQATSIPELLGLEGEAASLYFGNFVTMLKEDVLTELGWTWAGRQGRGANDPINILLNYAYGMLSSECIRGILTCGLDPHAGFLHSSSRNKPALALDLMEEFRAVIADSVVVSLINRKQVKTAHFTAVGGSYRLTPEGRKTVIAAFEKRMATEITHPTYGYSVTWRRAIEVQARMLLGVINGTTREYTGVTVR